MQKNNTLRRFISLITALFMLVGCASMSGCSHDTSAAVMTLGEHSVTENMYHYWASRYKGQYIYQYDDVTNSDECWTKQLLDDGTTTAEYFDALTLENIKYTLVSMKLFDEYKLSVSVSEKSSIDANIGDIVSEYAEGSKNMMNTALSEYGINLSMLKDIYIYDLMSSKVYDYLYGENGAEPISDETKEEYYQENYVHFQMIFINNAYRYQTDSSGSYVTGEDGYYIQEDLPADIKAEKDASVKSVQQQLADGADYDELYAKYSEFTSYANGFYFSKNDSTLGEQIYYDVIQAAADMETGEIQTVSGDYGTCIVKKLELDSGGWNDTQNKDFFTSDQSSFTDTVGDQLFRAKLSAYFDDITVDEEAIKAFSVASVTPAYSF